MIKLKIIETTDKKYIGTEIEVHEIDNVISFGDFYFEFDKHEQVGLTHIFSSSNYIIKAEEI